MHPPVLCHYYSQPPNSPSSLLSCPSPHISAPIVQSLLYNKIFYKLYVPSPLGSYNLSIILNHFPRRPQCLVPPAVNWQEVEYTSRRGCKVVSKIWVRVWPRYKNLVAVYIGENTATKKRPLVAWYAKQLHVINERWRECSLSELWCPLKTQGHKRSSFLKFALLLIKKGSSWG